MRRLGSIGALILLLLFFGSATMLLILGITTYEGIAKSSEEQFNVRMSIQYVTDKVHNYDCKGEISVREIQGAEVLVFTEKEAQDTYETWIYGYRGNLYEMSKHKVEKSSLNVKEMLLREGNVIAKVEVLSITTVQPNLIKIRLKAQEDMVYTYVLLVRSNLKAV